ncbi:hypothetical protein PC116_g18897 [Phytophthora cactorum]|nr:hypothetical protein PC119_g7909 [Phytophthora cactorum]KAG3194286.1 hypothetical protein PC128_g9499 [Phytophthora cactorum]KAG4232870.1 hypothetical protein PC116_g18897 [Phytophthora cactorum]
MVVSDLREITTPQSASADDLRDDVCQLPGVPERTVKTVTVTVGTQTSSSVEVKLRAKAPLETSIPLNVCGRSGV